MAEQKKNRWIKPALEFGPIVAFFIAYMRLREQTFTIGGQDYEGFIMVTAAFVPLFVVSTALLRKLTGKLSRMQILTVVLVVFFGGLSVWFNDDRFFKMKPTAIYTLFAAILVIGLLRGQSYLKFVMEELVPLRDEGWMLLTKRFCAFFLGLALANEVIWRLFSTDTWVYFKTFGLTAALFVFFIMQSGLLQKYELESNEKG